MCLGMLKPRCIDRIQACRPSNVCSIGCTRRCEEELESNGYSVMVSAEGHSLVNERVSYHRVVLGVLRDAQTYEFQSRTRIQKLR